MFPDRLVPQLATLVDAPPKGGGWTYEIKLDGYRILARCDRGKVRLFTRNENDWTAKMQTLAREVANLKGRWSKRAVGSERWVKPTTVVEVSFTEWTPEGHIRHPPFRGVRKDRPASTWGTVRVTNTGAMRSG